jgi:hypothetical protein
MVSHPSKCELTPVRIDAVVGARLEWWRRFGFRQVMWLVMIESAKDRILGVDPQDNMYHHVSSMERLAY